MVLAVGSVACYQEAQQNITQNWNDFGNKTQPHERQWLLCARKCTECLGYQDGLDTIPSLTGLRSGSFSNEDPAREYDKMVIPRYFYFFTFLENKRAPSLNAFDGCEGTRW